jgi:hypothetical protein
MKIHMAMGGAISLKPDPRTYRLWMTSPARQKTVDGFQRVDESLGISDSKRLDANATAVSFFLNGYAGCACGSAISGSSPVLSL